MTAPNGLPPSAAPRNQTPPPGQGAGENIVRPAEPQARPSAPPLLNARMSGGGVAKGRFSPPKFGNPLAGLSGKLPENWWIGAILFVALVGGYYYFQAFGMPNFSAVGGKILAFPGMPGVKIVITLAMVALVTDCVLGLAEAQGREDPGLLDWWIPYVLVGVLMVGKIYPAVFTDVKLALGWAFFTGVAAAALVFATLWNPSDQEDPSLLDRIDTTGLFRTCFILGLLYLGKWPLLPYPAFIPPIAVLVVGALAIFKEIMRTPKFALIVILMGVAGAIFYNPWWIAGTLAVAMTMAAVGARQGWIPGAAQRRIEVTVPPIMGRKLKLILAWDVVITWFAVFVLTAIIIYNNPTVAVIGGR